MIRLPVRYLRILLEAITAARKFVAPVANMYRHAQIGNPGNVRKHDELKQLEAMLQGLLLEARNAKSKTFTLMLDSLVVSGLSARCGSGGVARVGDAGHVAGSGDTVHNGYPIATTDDDGSK